MTQTITSGRRTGKSTYTVLWMDSRPDSICVCFSAVEADRMFRFARDMGYDIERDRFVSYTQVREGVLHGRRVPAVAIDNADIILSGLIDRGIDLMTVTG